MPTLLAPILLFLVALLLRVLDIFVLRLDERWGEIILSKALGFLLVLLYVWRARASLKGLGLHGRDLGKALLVATVVMVPIFVVGFGLQYISLTRAGQHPTLVLAAMDPKTGMAGGLLFALWLVLGNVINSFMEEGLFRGVMLPHFGTTLSLWRANLLQAVLFALWHLVWPIKDLVTGRADIAGAAAQAALLLAGTLISGCAFGYLYLKTGNLWAPWLAHTLNNTVLNLLHIRTTDGLDTDLTIIHAVLGLGLLAALAATRVLAGWLGLSPRITFR